MRVDPRTPARWLCALAFLGGCSAMESAVTDADPHDGHEPAADGGANHSRDASLDQGAPPVWDMTQLGATRLSQTGLYTDIARGTLAPGVIPYTPRYETWSDGATQRRWLWLPPGARIDTNDMDHWAFPVGTKVWRELAWRDKVVETRYLEKVNDGSGGWYEVSFAWDAGHTDAMAAIKTIPKALGTPLDVPGRDTCGSCHVNVRDAVIGVSAIQLSAPGGNSQLHRFAMAGLLSSPPADEFEVPGVGAIKAALANLHTNCGHCHNEEAPLSNFSPLLLRLHVADKTPEETNTWKTSVGVKMFHPIPVDIVLGIAPGNPEKSQLFMRMAVRNEWAMPALDTKVADSEGCAAIREWILGLK